MESACEAGDNYRKAVWERNLLLEEYKTLEKVYFKLRDNNQKLIKEQSESTNENNLLKDHMRASKRDQDALRNVITKLRMERKILRTLLLGEERE